MPKPPFTEERSRAEVQQSIRNKADSIAIRREVTRRMRGTRRIRDGDCRSIDHFDLQRCISAGAVTDFGCCEGGVLATVCGTDTEGENLVVVVYVPDDHEFPLLIEDFELGWA